MSVLGIGTDIVAVARVAALLERHGDRFLARCFQDAERQQLSARRAESRAAAVAGRWAAKEAFLKALGGTIGHIPYHEITVRSAAGGSPSLQLTGRAAQALVERGGTGVHLTISHEREFAVASVLIEA